MTRTEDERLRETLHRATPVLANPRRLEEVRGRVRLARRRRARMAGAAVLAVAVVAGVRVWGLPSGHQPSAAVPPAVWAPPGFTDIPRPSGSGAASSSPGWYSVVRPDGTPGTRAVVAYRPEAAPAGPVPVPAGGALVFFVQTEKRTPRTAVREVSPPDGWCRAAGGTRELERAASGGRAGTTGRPAYACLHDASAEVTGKVREILATAAFSR